MGVVVLVLGSRPRGGRR